MQEVVELLKKNNKTISSMESCTGGGFINSLTNIEGASEVIQFSCVTYSNEYKIKMGVNQRIIDEYSVYSPETAREMSKAISNFTNSSFGVGITGKLNKVDINNMFGQNNVVYISIYDKNYNKYYDKSIKVDKELRYENKELVINEIINILKNIL